MNAPAHNNKPVQCGRQGFHNIAFFRCLTFFLLFLAAGSLRAQVKLWGMTARGGEFNAGTIINLNTDGSDFNTFSFYRNIGSEPKGDLLAASNGKLYGMTSNGGGTNDGVIFEYDPVTNVYVAAHQFSYGTDGATPYGTLTELGGKLYGMTFEGGSYGDGVLFEFDPAGNVLTVLRHFDTDPDGGFSHCSLIESGGKLYGMNTSGGDNADGTLFEFNPVGNVFTVLKHFDRPTDGGRPRGSLLEWGGKFYGMASDGGSTDDGTLFEFNPAGNVLTVLKHFNGATDGERPFGSLIAVGGKFYGMANQHGSNGYGTLFEFNPSGNVFTVLKHLDYSTDGGLPFGSLIASGGKFYGMTSTGGSNGFGTLFEFNPSGNVFTVLKHFDDSTDGAEPYGSLIESGGKFYGMTNQSGSDDDGTLFEFNPVNNLFTVLKHLNGSDDGRRPQSSLLESGGKLYGTTASGGNNGYGTLFEHTPAENVHTVLKHFNYFLDGAYPNGSPIESGGKLYGMTNQGGSNDFGTLYEFNPASNVFTVLKHLNATTDGAYPNGSLLESGSKLYGMTAAGGISDAGTLFEFNPASNMFTVLKHFGGADGVNPYGSLLESGGKFYGMTAFGGSNDDGTLFEWNPAGNVFTVLKHFGGVDGAHPTGSLIASGGKFYGMTPIAGSNNAGTLFELNPAGNVFTVLRHFDSSTDGAYPNGSLLESGGKFYGMTVAGGSNDDGTLFEFNPAGNVFTVLKHLNATDGSNPQYGNLIAIEPEINLRGNGMDIADGDNTPSSTDHTDFGQPTGTVVRTFTVQNTGSGSLSVTGITLTGAGAPMFSAGPLTPASPVPVGQSATFAVTYTPTAQGVHTATVNIASSDGDEATYNFDLKGELTCSPPTFTNCPNNLAVNASAGTCSATVNYTVAATSSPAPTLAYTFTGATVGSGSGTGSGSTFNKGATTVTVTATNFCGAPTCTFTVTVNDTQLPTITCPANQTKSTNAGQCSAVTNYTVVYSDNCMGSTATLVSGIASGSPFPKGITTVQWKATDGAGLTKTCSFRVTVNDTQLPTISCPASQSLNTDPNLCSAVATYATPTASDNCAPPPTVVKTSGLSSGSAFPKGSSTVVWKATDGAGLTKTCSFTVTVTDAQLPTIACPQSISVTGSGSPCTATVNYATPTATDNCAIQSVFLLNGMGSGSSFPSGMTTVVWRAIDNSGGSATCAFTVTVGCGASHNPSEGGENVAAERDAVTPPLRGDWEGLLRLAPNPATTHVQIWTENLGEKGGELTVFDIQGRMVWQHRFGSETLTSGQQPTVTLDVAGEKFAAGVYFVTLRAEGKAVTKRLVVARQ